MNNGDIENELCTRTQTKISLLHFDSIDSTNQYAKKLIQKKAIQNPCLVWADQQTAGVGKRARHFYSPAGGLYLSLILPDMTVEPEKIGLFTTNLAMAIVKSSKNCFDLSVQVKWVNDIYLNSRKIAGILVEQGAKQSVIIGVGINLFQLHFPKEIEKTAGNLLSLPPTPLEREKFLIEIVSNLYHSCITYTNSEFIGEYKRLLTLMNHRIQMQIGRTLVTGKVIDVNALGQLVIIDEATEKKRIIRAGEVTKILP